MIKYFCDKCGKEIESGNLCSSCQEEELTCGFKKGDTVITDDGRTGFINGFCTCEKCKSRGFYEPKVITDEGMIPIHITNLDKDNGFPGFYRIGNRVFGNVDRDAVSTIKKLISISERTIKELETNIEGYKVQLRMAKTLGAAQKEEKEINGSEI